MTSNTHYYPCCKSFPLEIWDISLLFTHFSFNFSQLLQFRISHFLPFGGVASLKSAPLKVPQYIVYKMWFYFTNNFKRFETSPKHKLLSHYQSNYVKWLVHIVELTCFNIASIKLTVVNIYGIFGC